MWECKGNEHLTERGKEEAEELLELMAEYEMEMILEPGIGTRRNWRGGRETRTDNVFISGNNWDWVISCQVKKQNTPPGTDHFPIETVIEVETTRKEIKEEGWNWKGVDWEDFNEELGRQIKKWGDSGEITSGEQLDKYVEGLEERILITTNKLVPKKSPSPFTKRWWTKELMLKRKQVRKEGRKSNRWRSQPMYPAHEISKEKKTSTRG